MAKIDYEKLGMTEEEFDGQYLEATERGRRTLESLPKAESAKYDKRAKRLILNMKNGTTLLVPVHLIQGLQTADDNALSDFDLVTQGTAIHWHSLDVQFYVKSLLNGVFGTPKWMENLNQKSLETEQRDGTQKSETKESASSKNDKKGGRPNSKVA